MSDIQLLLLLFFSPINNNSEISGVEVGLSFLAHEHYEMFHERLNIKSSILNLETTKCLIIIFVFLRFFRSGLPLYRSHLMSCLQFIELNLHNGANKIDQWRNLQFQNSSKLKLQLIPKKFTLLTINSFTLLMHSFEWSASAVNFMWSIQ